MKQTIEFFVYLEGITANPAYLKGWRILKMTASALRLVDYSTLLYS